MPGTCAQSNLRGTCAKGTCAKSRMLECKRTRQFIGHLFQLWVVDDNNSGRDARRTMTASTKC
jgi:hypothetical protein